MRPKAYQRRMMQQRAQEALNHEQEMRSLVEKLEADVRARTEALRNEYNYKLRQSTVPQLRMEWRNRKRNGWTPSCQLIANREQLIEALTMGESK